METSSNNMDKNQIDFFTCAAFHVLLGNFEKKNFSNSWRRMHINADSNQKNYS